MPTPAKKTARKAPAKKAAAPKLTDAEKAPGVTKLPSDFLPTPAQIKGDDLLLDLSPTMQDQADTHFRNQGKAGGYFHGTNADGRAIYRAID